MNGGEAAVPVPVLAVSGTGAAAVERWADGLRADLARLTTQLHELRVEADAAERGSARTGFADEAGRRMDFLPLVDDTLAAARARVEVMLRLALEKSSGVVTGAMEEAADSLRSGVAAGEGRPEGDVIVLDTRDDERAVAPVPAPPDASSRQFRDRVRRLAERTRT